MLNMLYQIEESGVRSRKTWVRDVKNLLFVCNLQDIWNYQAVNNVNDFVDTFTERFKRFLFSEWYSDVCTLEKLNWYRRFKFTLDPARYVFSVRTTVHMQMLARLRCSSHYLRVETDRKHGIERYMRLCQLCDSKEVEDEYHFLLVCSFFNVVRTKYLPRFYF